MSGWLRMDGEFVENPKVMEVSDRAFRLHVAGMCYSTRNLTDGILSVRAVKVVCALTCAIRKHVVELRDVKLWIPVDDGGYEIKDYLLHNPTAAELKDVRDARREAGRKGGLKSGETRRRNREANAAAGAVAKEEAFASNHRTLTEQELKPDRPVGEQAHKNRVGLESRAAAEALLGAIRPNHRDAGTEHVVLAYAQELEPKDFQVVRRELEKRRGEIRNDGKWVNGALQKRAMKRAANAA